MTADSKQPPNDALAELLTQLEDLVRLSLEAERKDFVGDTKSFTEAHQKLLEMNRVAEAMTQGYQKALQSFSLTEEDVKKFRENLQGKEKRMSDTIDHMIQECEAARARAYKSLQENRSAVQSIKEELKDEEQKGRKRRDRFKSVGGKKGWMKT
ncbi:MAG TPA: hypothetical protein VN457_01545 [Chlamydiales bacterium]|nr:hypothetical protein [Chlamydiales bacterium]